MVFVHRTILGCSQRLKVSVVPNPLWRQQPVLPFLMAAGSVVSIRICNRFTSSNSKTEDTVKKTVVSRWDKSKKYWMSPTEYTGVVVGKEATNGEYVITDGVIGPGGFVPDHYHKWEDQTFHVIAGQLEAKIGSQVYQIGPGDTIHCPRGVTHFLRNDGTIEAKLISYIFPGHWAEDFMAETSRRNHAGKPDLKLIEETFGVVYV